MSFSFVRKIESWILYLFIFSLPLQKRLVIFQPDWAFNEWRSFFFYWTDFLLIILLLYWLFEITKFPAKVSRHDYFLFAFIVLAGVSAKNAFNIDLAIYQTIKLVEFVLLYFYIKSYAKERFDTTSILLAFIVSGLAQATIAIAQFVKQGSIGLGFLGESFLRSDMQGVAVFLNQAGEKVMRAYGTTPHPNILSAYLLLVIIAIYYSYLKGVIKEKFLFFSYPLVLFGFLMTFSRTTIGVWVLSFLLLAGYSWIKKVELKKLKRLVATTSVICALFGGLFSSEIISRLTISSEDEAVRMRIYYNQQALNSGKGWDLNWTGVGIGNFVTWFMRTRDNLPKHYYQPAHNVFLLIYSEIGILGITVWLGFIGLLIKRNLQRLRSANIEQIFTFVAFGGLLIVASFDHFPWTLQQGRLMWWILLGLI